MSEATPKFQLSFFMGPQNKAQVVIRTNDALDLLNSLEAITAETGDQNLSVMNGIMEHLETIGVANGIKFGASTPPARPAANNTSAPRQNSQPSTGNGRQVGWGKPGNEWANGQNAPTGNDGNPMVPMSGVGKNGRAYKAWISASGQGDPVWVR